MLCACVHTVVDYSCIIYHTFQLIYKTLTSTCMHACTHTHIYIYIYIIYVHVYVCYAHVHVCMYACTCMYACMYTYNMYIYMYMHECMQVHMYNMYYVLQYI